MTLQNFLVSKATAASEPPDASADQALGGRGKRCSQHSANTNVRKCLIIASLSIQRQRLCSLLVTKQHYQHLSLP